MQCQCDRLSEFIVLRKLLRIFIVDRRRASTRMRLEIIGPLREASPTMTGLFLISNPDFGILCFRTLTHFRRILLPIDLSFW